MTFSPADVLMLKQWGVSPADVPADFRKDPPVPMASYRRKCEELAFMRREAHLHMEASRANEESADYYFRCAVLLSMALFCACFWGGVMTVLYLGTR